MSISRAKGLKTENKNVEYSTKQVVTSVEICSLLIIILIINISIREIINVHNSVQGRHRSDK
jgi:hypothetical protein